MAWYRSPKVWRQATMIFFFVFLVRVAYRHLNEGGGPRGEPSVEAYCPFGGLENLYQFITTGGYIRRIEPSTMIVFAAVLLLTLLFSRGFCGWVCPFGSIQEWTGMIGKRIFGKRYNPTGAWDRALRYLKYAVLGAIVALTWWSGTLVFRDYDPFLAFFHLGQHVEELRWAYAILGVVLAGSLLIERFFCKYACPLGAVLGLVGRIGLTRIHRDTEGCKECNLCFQRCHAHVDFLSVTEIKTPECNHCLDCVVDCPKPNVLSVRANRWRFSHPVYAGLLVAGLFGLIGASKAMAVWRTKPAAISVTDAAGRPDPEAIRGWMTLEDISREFGMPLEELYAGSRLPFSVAATTQIREIRQAYGIDFEPDSIRGVVGQWLLAGSGTAEAAPPAGADESRPAPVRRSRSSAEERGPGAGKDREGEAPAVRGNMTLNEIVLKTGVPLDYILGATGLPKEVPVRTPLREWIHDYGVTPRDIRAAVEKHRAGSR
jgi:polyferredoxin